MYLLDTMILSELRKGTRANKGVLDWTRATPDRLRYLSVPSIVEMRRGALQVYSKDPLQSRALHEWLNGMLSVDFTGRILPIDQAVAERAASLHIPTQREAIDMFIAATALEHDFTLITRNERHFAGIGVRILNPFT